MTFEGRYINDLRMHDAISAKMDHATNVLTSQVSY